MAKLEFYRKSIRVSSNALDEQIEAEIKTALRKLSAAGCELVDDSDPLIIAAVVDYLRWQHNYEGDAVRYEDNFRKLADEIALNRSDFDVRQSDCPCY